MPPWRRLLATFNWRPVFDIEMREVESEKRTKQIEKEILRVRSDSEQIEKETEQIRRENVREKALSALIRQRCFPPESSSIPQPSIESDCGTSLR